MRRLEMKGILALFDPMSYRTDRGDSCAFVKDVWDIVRRAVARRLYTRDLEVRQDTRGSAVRECEITVVDEIF